MNEVLIGSITLFAGSFEPVGWMFCDGRLLSPSQYQQLCSIISNTYGGDGQTTFALPNLPPVAAVGGKRTLRYIINLHGAYPSRP